MALVVEDGTVVTGANSYIDLADANTYFTEHGSPSGWTGTDAVKEGALLYAAEWIDSVFEWKGVIVDDDQEMDWPRDNVYDDEGRALAITVIPERLREAQCEAALEHLTAALNTGLDRGGMVKRERVEGAVEIEYMDGASGSRSRPYVSRLLAPFILSGPGSFRFQRS